MSQAKRLLETQEAKQRAAMGIAIAAGVIKRCEFHEDCLFMGIADKEGAYKLRGKSGQTERFPGDLSAPQFRLKLQFVH
jgi:hypothetical protein